MQKLADRGLQNISSQLTDPSAPPGIIEEWKIGGAVGSVIYTFTRQLQWNLDLVTDLVTQKSVTKSWVVTKSMYFMY